MQLVAVLFSDNFVECRLNFNPIHCEFLRTSNVSLVRKVGETKFESPMIETPTASRGVGNGEGKPSPAD